MKVGTLANYNEIKPNYLPYYIITIVSAIAIGYFLIIGGKVLRAIFVLGVEYWWVVVIGIIAIIFLKKKVFSK